MNVSLLMFIIYGFTVIAIGIFLKKKERSNFWTASRSLSGWSVGLSISAGFMSVSWSCVYATQVYYWYGLGGIWLIAIPWIISLMAIFLLSRKFASLPAFSQPEMAQMRYGKQGKIIVVLALIFVFLVWGGAEIYIAASLLAPLLNVSVFGLITMIALLVAAYSILGGFKAVITTDKLQYFLVAVYIILVFLSGIKGIYLRPKPFTFDLYPALSRTSWITIFSPGLGLIFISLVAYLPGWIFETDLWVRIQAASSAKEARKGIILSIFNSILFVGIFPLFIAAIALFLYPVDHGVIPAALGNQGDAIFFRLVKDFAPTWLLPVVSLGLIAAAMSTIDTCTNIVSLSLGYDLYPEIFNQKPSTRINMIATISGVSLAWLFALNTNSLWNIFYLSSGILTTTVAIPMLGIIWKSLLPKAVIISSWCGLIVTFVTYYYSDNPILQLLTPEWISRTGLGYIIWGLGSAILTLVFFQIFLTRSTFEAGK